VVQNFRVAVATAERTFLTFTQTRPDTTRVIDRSTNPPVRGPDQRLNGSFSLTKLSITLARESREVPRKHSSRNLLQSLSYNDMLCMA
jgi:hypothetical protein